MGVIHINNPATTQLIRQRTARVKCCHNLIPDWSVFHIKHRYKQTPALNLHRPSTIPLDFVLMHIIRRPRHLPFQFSSIYFLTGAQTHRP